VNAAALQPRRREPPAGWSAETFERVTDALARTLVENYRGEREREEHAEAR
jgi:hypothetical protein